MTDVDWTKAQKRLGNLYPATIDGKPGVKTWIGVVAFAATAQPAAADPVTLRGRKLAEVAQSFGLTTAERIAGFLSNTPHETADYTKLREDLYYKTAAQIRRTWPSRFPTEASALPFVRNPEALANKVYARPAEGNDRPGDGFLFRGGGDIQTTFANGYRRMSVATGLPLYQHPELIETPAVALLTGLVYWRDNGLNRFYDAGTPKRGRALINTGNPDKEPIGWDDVSRRHARLMELLG